MRRVGFAILVLALVLQVSCAREAPGERAGESKQAGATAEHPQGSIAAPSPRLAKPVDYPGVDSTQGLLELLAPHDRALVVDFYGRHDPAAIRFDNRAQLDWMLQHGYPMPEDIVAAERLTEAELLALHRQGDPKAGYFYLDRFSQGALSERGMVDGIAREVLVNGSPFAGYAYARYQRSKGDPHSALAGYAWAGWLGDRRALVAMAQAQQELGQLNPKEPLEPATSVLAFANLLKTAQSSRPALVSRRARHIPYETALLDPARR